MNEIEIQEKIDQLKSLLESMDDTDNGAIDMIDALVPLNIIDDIVENESEEMSYIFKLKKYKTKIDSKKQIAEIVKKLLQSLSSETGTAKLRAWVDKIKSKYPDVALSLKEENIYLQDISNEIGSRTIGKTYDTQSVSIEDWEEDVSLFRKNVAQKLKSQIVTNATSSYNELNERFADQLSNTYTPDTSYKTSLEESISDIESQIEGILGDAIRLINYLYPINTSIKISDKLLIIEPSVNEIVIDIRGNKITKAAEKITDGVLCPCTR